MADVDLVGEWLLEYACFHRMTSVIHVFSKETPGHCTAPNFVTQILSEAVGEVPARYMIATIETIMENEDTEQYATALRLVEHLFDAMHENVQFKIYAKVMTGLKILLLFHVLRENKTKAFALLNKYFPKDGYSHPHAPRHTLKKITDGNKNFRDFFVPMVSDPFRRRTYFAEHFENDFGPTFLDSLQNHVKTLTTQMKLLLSDPTLIKLMEHPEAQEKLAETSEVLDLVLNAIEGKKSLTEPETRELVLSLIKASKPDSKEMASYLSEGSSGDLDALLGSESLPAKEVDPSPTEKQEELASETSNSEHQEIKIQKSTDEEEQSEEAANVDQDGEKEKMSLDSETHHCSADNLPSEETSSEVSTSEKTQLEKTTSEISPSKKIVTASSSSKDSPSKKPATGENLHESSESKEPSSMKTQIEGSAPNVTSTSVDSEREAISLPSKESASDEVALSQKSESAGLTVIRLPVEGITASESPSKRSRTEGSTLTESPSKKSRIERLASTESPSKRSRIERLALTESPSKRSRTEGLTLTESPSKRSRTEGLASTESPSKRSRTVAVTFPSKNSGSEGLELPESTSESLPSTSSSYRTKSKSSPSTESSSHSASSETLPSSESQSHRSQSESLPSTESSSNRNTSESLPSSEPASNTTNSEKPLSCGTPVKQVTEKPEEACVEEPVSKRVSTKRPLPEEENSEGEDVDETEMIAERRSSLRSGSSPLKRPRTDSGERKLTLRSTPPRRHSSSQSSDDILSPSPQILRAKMTSSFRFRSTQANEKGPKDTGKTGAGDAEDKLSSVQDRIGNRSGHPASPGRANTRRSLGSPPGSPSRVKTDLNLALESPGSVKAMNKPTADKTNSSMASPQRESRSSESKKTDSGPSIFGDSGEGGSSVKEQGSKSYSPRKTQEVTKSPTKVGNQPGSCEVGSSDDRKDSSGDDKDPPDTADDCPTDTQVSLFGTKTTVRGEEKKHNDAGVSENIQGSPNEPRETRASRKSASPQKVHSRPSEIPGNHDRDLVHPSGQQTSHGSVKDKSGKTQASPSQELVSASGTEVSPSRVEGSPGIPQGSLSDVQSSPSKEQDRDTHDRLSNPQESPSNTLDIYEDIRPSSMNLVVGKESLMKLQGIIKKVKISSSSSEDGSSPTRIEDDPNPAQRSPRRLGQTKARESPRAQYTYSEEQENPQNVQDSPDSTQSSPTSAQRNPTSAQRSPTSAYKTPSSASDNPTSTQGSPGSAQGKLSGVSCSLGKVSAVPHRGRGSRIRGGARPRGSRSSISPRVKDIGGRMSPSSATGSPASAGNNLVSAKNTPAAATDNSVSERRTPASLMAGRNSLNSSKNSLNSAVVSPEVVAGCPFLAVSSPLDKPGETSQAPGGGTPSSGPTPGSGMSLLRLPLSNPASRTQSPDDQSHLSSCSFRTCVQDLSDGDWQSCADVTDTLEDKDLDASFFKTCQSSNQQNDSFSSMIVPSSNSFDKYNVICGTTSQLVGLSLPNIQPSQHPACRQKCIVKLYKSKDPDMENIYL